MSHCKSLCTVLYRSRRAALAAGLLTGLALRPAPAAAQTVARPPSVPLVAFDPYFSVWSDSDTLTGDWSRHWTGAVNAMVGLIQVDGKTYRFAGTPRPELPAMTQIGLDVTATQTTYKFEADGVKLTLNFLTPSLPKDLDVLARPVTYIEFRAASQRGTAHKVKLYFDATGEWAVNTPDQKVVWNRVPNPAMTILQIGTEAQPILAKRGDNLRIDWGHFVVAVPKQPNTQSQVSADTAARDGFVANGAITGADDAQMPRAANDNWPVLATTFDLGDVTDAVQTRRLLLAYDADYAIQLMGQKLRPYWKRSGATISELVSKADREYPALKKRCDAFDKQVAATAAQAGGADYAKICVLAYRQCLAAHGLAADADGKPLMFPKENFSNGCISTVDILYPSAPFFLLFNTELLRAQLTPVLDYSASPRWKFPFAPHDLGTYPIADGQVYGGGERDETDQMPVEETGNMLLMLAAMAKIDGKADYAAKYWPQLEKWAAYLKDKGLDPENQLCTDDFAGHLAHNTNLSLKAIEALGGYAMLCDLTGHKKAGAAYRKTALAMAAQWQTMAQDGDHFRLTFDRAGTWSQKYNLVWDKILGPNLFPKTVAQTEITYYKKRQNPYGLPLDNRSKYTKLDWTIWTATLASQPQDFEVFAAPLVKFLNESPSRVPMTDWFWTTDAKQSGFQARSVVGGVFIRELADPKLWRKWATAK